MSSDAPESKKPVSVIVIGMAGSGKTTLMQALGNRFEDGTSLFICPCLRDPQVCASHLLFLF